MGAGLLTLAMLAAASLAGAQQAPAAPTDDNRVFTLSPHIEKGQVWRYQTQSAMRVGFHSSDPAQPAPSVDMAMEITVRYRVLETRPDGTVVLSVLTDSGKLINPPDPITPLKQELDSYPRTATLDKMSRLLAIKDPSASQEAGGLSGLLGQPTSLFLPLHFLPLPDKPIKVGDSWSATYAPTTGGNARAAHTSDQADPAEAIQSKMTLLGTEKLDNQDTLKIKQEMVIPFLTQVDAQNKPTTDSRKAVGRVQVQLTFTQIVNALPTDGEVLKSDGTISGWIKLEGAAAKGLPGDTLQITGKLYAIRLSTGAATDTPGAK
jgi:hypothetical protein